MTDYDKRKGFLLTLESDDLPEPKNKDWKKHKVSFKGSGLKFFKNSVTGYCIGVDDSGEKVILTRTEKDLELRLKKMYDS